jgi:hypothetical protein
MSRTLVIERFDGHRSVWQQDLNLYCPNCGHRGVLVRTGDCEHIAPGDCTACRECGAQWDYPNVAIFEPV